MNAPRHRLETSLGAKSLPEMTFGSELTLTHAGSGVQLAFTAADALREWKVCHPLVACVEPQCLTQQPDCAGGGAPAGAGGLRSLLVSRPRAAPAERRHQGLVCRRRDRRRRGGRV